MHRSQLLKYFLAFALLFFCATASTSERTYTITTDPSVSPSGHYMLTTADHVEPVPHLMRWRVKVHSWSAPLRKALPSLASPTLARLRLAMRDTIAMVRNWLHDVYLAPPLEFHRLIEAPRADCPPRDKMFAFDNTIEYMIPENVFDSQRLHLHLALDSTIMITEQGMVAVREAMLDHPDPFFAAMQQYGRIEKAIDRAFFYEGLTAIDNPPYYILDCIRDSIQTDLREKFRDGVQRMLVTCFYARDTARCYEGELAFLFRSLVKVWRDHDRMVIYRATFGTPTRTYLPWLATNLLIQFKLLKLICSHWAEIVYFVKRLIASPAFSALVISVLLACHIVQLLFIVLCICLPSYTHYLVPLIQYLPRCILYI